ncbi:Crp/Fnr family transcriptional regulator [Listeria cossartiae]|uniref:Crp/Fnr family transcriptional regulator n=1 Tax=Listeria cossartiae subsp. cayugensis TaxID=2713505 RepID=A0A7X1DCR4_9LIST|nr:Crp/Fnr family transcriptional regulator [Listeria cossartiae]MBC1806619.1 Crp/Fnr family transcriptional regulator [Listeria cossartiae subsp. cayugensis]MBC2250626.1 Crp/Fnr family transcriptional regulator [Listeria cossartiae subsp. cayugensis]MCD2223160.1 Crp/Fnr family transcriptional regulator [Listeria cossartiae]MCD2237840.1 Crp/Fnr family transcriptional regulator [Listeria cossartiae]MDT0004178.1 Crp/Fnr family transcriptional regulator [Listeria cossartiae subsp. cayugensis]
MTFLEFHRLISQDLLIYSWIRKNFSLTHQELEVGKELKLQHGQIIIMEKGLMIQESAGKKSTIERIFAGERIIYTTERVLLLSALENTTYSIIPTDELFEKLDEHNLLSNFFLQIAEDFEKSLEWQREIMSAGPEERVEKVLLRIIKWYELHPASKPVFPRWLKIYVLAKLAKCSVSTTSLIINGLADKGIINVKKTPWILMQDLEVLCVL